MSIAKHAEDFSNFFFYIINSSWSQYEAKAGNLDDILQHCRSLINHHFPSDAGATTPTTTPKAILHTPADYGLPRASDFDASSTLSPASTSWMGSHLLCIALLPADAKRKKTTKDPFSWMNRSAPVGWAKLLAASESEVRTRTKNRPVGWTSPPPNEANSHLACLCMCLFRSFQRCLYRIHQDLSTLQPNANPDQALRHTPLLRPVQLCVVC